MPWREIIGTRTILAHGYFHVDQDVVGGIVDSHVPQLRRQIAAILDGLDGSNQPST